MTSVGIIGLGNFLPNNVVTNDDIVKMGLDTSNQWIVERTGIQERRIAPTSMATSDMAYEAATQAINNASINANDIDLVIVATTSPDYPTFPSTACLLQHKLKIKNAGAFDLAAACTGFNYALTTGAQYIKTGQAKNVLVVGADCLSKFVDWSDRSICILFGDGAGAAVLSAVDNDYGILASELHSDGSAAELLITRSGGSKKVMSTEVLEKKEHLIQMDGKAVFKKAINSFVPTIKKVLQDLSFTAKDVDYFIPHQANKRIIDYAREKLDFNENQVITNIHKYGNTSAASIPIALSEAHQNKKIKKDNIIVLAGFGAGFTWAVNVLRWSY